MARTPTCLCSARSDDYFEIKYEDIDRIREVKLGLCRA